MTRFCLIIILLLVAFGAQADSAQAEVYRCEINGKTVFTDQECANGQGEPVDLDAANLSVAEHMVTPGIAALAEEHTQRMAAIAAERAAQRQRQQVPGVACPNNREIRAAVAAQRIAMCMTPEEVTAAQPAQMNPSDIQQRQLQDGVTVMQWFYAAATGDWPARVQFQSGHVIGYASSLPTAYDRRPSRYTSGYYWPRHYPHHHHGHSGNKPVQFDPELYQLQPPTIIDPPQMNAYPRTEMRRPDRHEQHNRRHDQARRRLGWATQ